MPQEPESARLSRESSNEVLSVSQLNRSVRDLLEHRFPLLWVHGEISNFTLAKSGHAYFSLKDAQSQVRCAMFRNRLQYLDWRPADGMQVEVQGLVTLYEARGDYQLVVETARRAGVGALYEAFLRLRDRLAREGLFDDALKRALPSYPRCIGLVTSLKAAALRDVLTTLARRNPSVPIVIYPTAVQGSAAAQQIVSALASAGLRRECDVILLCRGGGSIEDMWPFNDEIVARALRKCPIPVITGIGHETDITIADFAADRRAATPTAAAELASPSRNELLAQISGLVIRTQRRTRRALEIRAQTIDSLSRRLVHPARRIAARQQALAGFSARLSLATLAAFNKSRWLVRELAHRVRAHAPDIGRKDTHVRAQADRLTTGWRLATQRSIERVRTLETSLAHLNPQSVLERGYTLARTPGGAVVRDSASLSPGDEIELTFARGSARTRVIGPRT